jgi:hypothetical protein
MDGTGVLACLSCRCLEEMSLPIRKASNLTRHLVRGSTDYPLLPFASLGSDSSSPPQRLTEIIGMEPRPASFVQRPWNLF